MNPDNYEVSSSDEAPGLSAKYPGDRGIENDPAVLLAESFETGTVQDLYQCWNNVLDRDGESLSLVEDAPPGSAGRRCLQLTTTLGRTDQAHLYRTLARPVDTYFARFYAKFPADPSPIHHGIQLGGNNPPADLPQPHAGERPLGDDRVIVGIEPKYILPGCPPPPGSWAFYAYWHQMRPLSSGEYAGSYYGNIFYPESAPPIPCERWQCVEVMIKLNTAPQSDDGELALWIDGRKTMHLIKGTRLNPVAVRDDVHALPTDFAVSPAGSEVCPGFNWRTSLELKLNFFWLLHYVSLHGAIFNNCPNPNPVNRVWYDDIVVSTRYVGPIVP